MKNGMIYRGGRFNDAGELTYSLSEAAKIIDEPFTGRNIILGYMRDRNIVDSNRNLNPEYNDGIHFEQELSTGYHPFRKMLFAPIRVKEAGIEFLRKLCVENRPYTFIDDTDGKYEVIY